MSGLYEALRTAEREDASQGAEQIAEVRSDLALADASGFALGWGLTFVVEMVIKMRMSLPRF
jgi:hypothetical protein